MNKGRKILKITAVLLLAACIAFGGYLLGQRSKKWEIEAERLKASVISLEKGELEAQQRELQEINRAAILGMKVEDGPIYVIGHKSPDSDTVCSAIAYARLLQKLGLDRKSVV